MLAAAAAGADLAGEYGANIPEVGTGLLLEPNGRFQYFFTYGAADYTAKGTWKSEEGAVVLTTDGKNEPPVKLSRSTPGKGRAVRIHVVAQNGAPIQQVDVALTGGAELQEARTDRQGVAVFEESGGAKSIEVRVPVYDMLGGPFALSGAGEYWVEVNVDAITQVPFKGEKLKVTERGLEMRFWNPNRPIVYRRQK